MNYGICDDYGVWVVSSGGKYETEEAAQEECNRRNHEEGTANEDGELKSVVTKVDELLWYEKHLSRPDCTCEKKGSLGQVSKALSSLN